MSIPSILRHGLLAFVFAMPAAVPHAADTPRPATSRPEAGVRVRIPNPGDVSRLAARLAFPAASAAQPERRSFALELVQADLGLSGRPGE